jgi:hypothetical protein
MSVAYSAEFSSLPLRQQFSKISHQNARLYKYADCMEKSPCHCVVGEFSSVGQWGNSLSVHFFLSSPFFEPPLKRRVVWGMKHRIRSNEKAPHSRSSLHIFKWLWVEFLVSGGEMFVDEVERGNICFSFWVWVKF